MFSFDHVYPISSANASAQPVVILYCQLGTVQCEKWHVELARLATEGDIQYIFRHHFEVHITSWMSTYYVALMLHTMAD